MAKQETLELLPAYTLGFYSILAGTNKVPHGLIFFSEGHRPQ
jgi:hypothetical protein